MPKTTLNMEQKRKLEKLIMQDIRTARQKYDAQARHDKGELERKLVKNPPKAVKSAYANLVKAEEAHKKAEQNLQDLGYRMNSYHDEDKLSISSYGKNTPKELIALSEKNDTISEKFDALEREYTLDLFAGDTETKDIFSQLAKRLQEFLK